MTPYCNRKHKSLASKENYGNPSLQNTNNEHPLEGPDNQMNFEIKLVNVNYEDRIDAAENDQNIMTEENVKEWRIIFKTVDGLMFILTFLGISGYFFGILGIHYFIV